MLLRRNLLTWQQVETNSVLFRRLRFDMKFYLGEEVAEFGAIIDGCAWSII